MDMVYFLFRQMLNFAIPLVLVSLGGVFSVQSGVNNIGLEGMMSFGAFCSLLFLSLTEGVMEGQPQLILAIAIAAASGMLISIVHALASISFRANQIISGAAINNFAPAFTIFTARLILGDSIIPFKNTFMIDEVPLLSKIPIIGDILFSKVYLTTYLGLAVLGASIFVLYKTRFGLRLRACGEHPQAPDSVGVNVIRIRYISVLLSGALAGVGGLVYVIPNATTFNGSVYGYGFLALAVMMLGQWTPQRVFWWALFFGTTMTISATYSAIPFLNGLGLSANYFKAMPYVLTLIVIALTRNSKKPPKAAGQPFEKGMR